MSELKLIARASGCRLYKQGELLIVKEQPSSWIPTVRFLLLLLSGIHLFFGIVQLIMFLRGYEIILFVSVLFIAVGSLFGFGFWLINKYSSKINSLPPTEFTTLCSFDLKNSTLLDAKGTVLDTLENSNIERHFQITSSAKKLVVRYSKGVIPLVKGNPFAGGIASLETIFRGEGLMK